MCQMEMGIYVFVIERMPRAESRELCSPEEDKKSQIRVLNSL